MDNNRITIHMIGNAHIDPVWLWRWQEGYQAAWATFRSALDRMKETSDFIFTCSQAALYEWIEEADPQMFDEIRERVREGRWEIVGGWWVQSDCNIPCGESLIRQSLYGQRYFMEKFGIKAKTGYCVDSFGHNIMLPQILKKSGMDFYVFMRPEDNNSIPRLFWWQSSDGSKILCYRIPFQYNTQGIQIKENAKKIIKLAPEGVSDMMEFYGVGNHGGGPTRENISLIKSMNNNEDGYYAKFSSTEEFFNAVSTSGCDLPVFDKELQHHAVGCYSVNAKIKHLNRKSEQIVAVAEKFSALAHVMFNTEYPFEDLKKAWKSILFNQFHDILPGSLIKEAFDDAVKLYGSAITISENRLNHALNIFAKRVDTKGEGIPVIVFNSLCEEINTPIEFEMQGLDITDDVLNGRRLTDHFPDIVLKDDSNKPIQCQCIKASASIGSWRIKIVFTDILPALGYRVYRVCLKDIKTIEEKKTFVNEAVLENDRYCIQLDKKTGCPRSIYDRKYEYELLDSKGCSAVVMEDKSDTWAHNVKKFNRKTCDFCNENIRIMENGPVSKRIRTKGTYNKSTLIQDFILYKGLDYIECRIKIDWREKRKMLKLSFPFSLKDAESTCEIPYGSINRDMDGYEQPGQQWVDVTGYNRHKNLCGITIANDSCCSYDAENGEIRLTLLRSPVFAHFHLYDIDQEEDFDYTDQGIHEFAYVIYSHRGRWNQSDAIPISRSINIKPFVIVDTWHEGKLPSSYSFISINACNIEAGILKTGEDRDCLIIRLLERAGKETKVSIEMPVIKRSWEAVFRANEIKTYRIPFDNKQEVEETSMLEY